MKRINRIYPAIVITGLICLAMMLGADAYAVDKNPCSEDIAKFCKNIKFGTPAMMDCLESNEDQLSAACKEYETTLGGKRVEKREQIRIQVEMRQACRGDVAKFCKDADPRQGGIAKCLKEHTNEISATCREKMRMADVEK